MHTWIYQLGALGTLLEPGNKLCRGDRGRCAESFVLLLGCSWLKSPRPPNAATVSQGYRMGQAGTQGALKPLTYSQNGHVGHLVHYHCTKSMEAQQPTTQTGVLEAFGSRHGPLAHSMSPP